MYGPQPPTGGQPPVPGLPPAAPGLPPAAPGLPPAAPGLPPAAPGPQRPGWARFWLGVLAGGCAVLLLEGVVGLVGVVMVGSAIRSALQQTGGGIPALPLPSGLTLPSGLPQLAARSDPCSPQPCMAHRGVTVLVNEVNRNAGPASESGAHLVEVQVTFVGTSGTHTVTPSELALREASGNLAIPGVDPSAASCGSSPAAADLQSGQRLGPYAVCYAVTEDQAGPLTLVWVDPEDFSLLELRLP